MMVENSQISMANQPRILRGLWGQFIKVTVMEPLRYYVSSDLVGSDISSIVYLTANV